MRRWRWLTVVALGALAVGEPGWGLPGNAGGSHPIVVGDLLLGGVVSRRWVDCEKMTPLVRGGERYWVYGPSGRVGQATGARARGNQAPGDWTEVRLTGAGAGGREYFAVCGDWNALPRPVRRQSTGQAVYRGEVAKILAANGLGGRPVRITDLVRVDLEGDGQEEVVLSANSMGEPPRTASAAGDYALVALRKIVKGKVQTILLTSEFHRTKGSFDAPNVHRLAAILDLNGDGVMEVVVRSAYYEGEGWRAYEVKGGAVRCVLEAWEGA